MKTKDLNYWTNRMQEYVNSASKHLFMDENDKFIKIVQFNDGENKMVACIVFGMNYLKVNVKKIEATSSNSLFFMKREFFPEWKKAKSIKNFKLARKLSQSITEHLEKNYKSDKKEVVIKELIDDFYNQSDKKSI